MIEPALFGQKYSSRDYTNPDSWGKNQFNSSFPASLVAYMSSQNVDLIYIKTTLHNKIVHKYISGEDLFDTTKSCPESEWGTEIVMRPPTICFLACSICSHYNTLRGKERLRQFLRQVPQINHWEEQEEVFLVLMNRVRLLEV
mgnify:CR=1 FL=1